MRNGTAWLTRAEIEEEQVLAGRGLEIAWIDDPVDVFFLQIQGSGRVRFPNGGGLRVGYGGKNGHEPKLLPCEIMGINNNNGRSATARDVAKKGKLKFSTRKNALFFRP